jgi:hypothetical protein
MDYAWQRLSAAEAGAIDIHLGECPECLAVLEEERALGDNLSAVSIVSPKQDLWDTVRTRQMALAAVAATTQAMAPAAMYRRTNRRAWTLSISAGFAALCLMLAPSKPVQEPTSGARDIAQTLDQARLVARQSDNPLRDVSDQTWQYLSEDGKESPL